VGADEESQAFLDALIGAALPEPPPPGSGILPLDIAFAYDAPAQLPQGGTGPVSIEAGVTLSQAVVDAAAGFGIAGAVLSNIELTGNTSGPGTLSPALGISDAGPYTIDFETLVVPTFDYSGTVTAGNADGTINYNFANLTVSIALLDGEGIEGQLLNLNCSADGVIASTVVGEPMSETTTTSTPPAAVNTSPKFTG
jgi:hypothetical protein